MKQQIHSELLAWVAQNDQMYCPVCLVDGIESKFEYFDRAYNKCECPHDSACFGALPLGNHPVLISQVTFFVDPERLYIIDINFTTREVILKILESLDPPTPEANACYMTLALTTLEDFDVTKMTQAQMIRKFELYSKLQ